MKYLKVKLPKDLLNYKAKKIININSIGELYLGFDFDKPKRKRRKR